MVRLHCEVQLTVGQGCGCTAGGMIRSYCTVPSWAGLWLYCCWHDPHVLHSSQLGRVVLLRVRSAGTVQFSSVHNWAGLWFCCCCCCYGPLVLYNSQLDRAAIVLLLRWSARPAQFTVGQAKLAVQASIMVAVQWLYSCAQWWDITWL